MKVAILGAGPAAMFAAHACRANGSVFRLFARDFPSTMYGAQFLSKQIPGVHVPRQLVHTKFQGNVNEYRNKVYGPDYTGPVSPPQYEGMRVVYDIRKAYANFADEYGNMVYPVTFDRRTFSAEYALLMAEFDLVVSSIPLNALCMNESHEFNAQKIFAIGDAPDRGVQCPVRLPAATVVYCATEEASWYRAANVFGHCTVEWSAAHRRKAPPFDNIAPVLKPLSNTCTCYPSILKIGRYGEWRKGVLAHHAYEKMEKHLKSRGVQGALF